MLLAVTIAFTGAGPDGYSLTPFDESRRTLPINYIGHSIARLVTVAPKLEAHRSQYETTELFEARKRKIRSRPLFGALSGDSRFAVLVPSQITYSADNERVNALVRLDKVENVGSLLELNAEPKAFKPSFARERYVGSFVGSNSFGVKRKVKRYERIEASLFFQNADDWGLGTFSDKRGDLVPEPDTIKLAAGLPRTIAPSVKPRLAVLSVFSLSEPIIAFDSNTDKATLDDPVEEETSRFFVSAEIRSLWLYDYKTGTVYARVKP